MTDSDPDGKHIESLLITFFYKLFPDLLKAGYVYKANPPLFGVSTNNKIIFLNNEKEKKDIIAKLEKQKRAYKIQRYKGLGEMDPDQLWETTMNPKTRLLSKITLNNKNMKKAEKMIVTMMGNDLEGRRQFIDKIASTVSLSEL